MNILKKSALGACATLLFITLFTFGLAFGIYRMLGSPDIIKGALRDSGIYQSIVSDALKQAQKEQPEAGQGQNQEQIPVDQPEVQNIIKTAASPELLQTQTEKALDSFYAWVQGKTPKLEFSIELGDFKKNLADGVGQYAEQKAAALPACSAANMPTGGDFDPFNATCLPSGVSPQQVSAQAKDQILNGEFLKDNKINADSIKGQDGQSVEQKLAAIPAGYKKVTWAVFGTGIAALLMAVAVVFLSVNWRSGLKKVAITAIVVGALTAVLSWAPGFGLDKAADVAKEPLQQSGIKVAQALVDALSSWWLWYGVALVVAGIVTLVVLHFVKPKLGTNENSSENMLGGDDLSENPILKTEPKSADKPKPKPVKKLVQ